jgi:glycosyltransferase involved in cell wall biosynthesis
MHSSLPQQVANFRYRGLPGLHILLGWLERVMIRGSRVVVVICADLETTVRQIRSDVPTVLIENAPGSGDRPREGSGAAIRQSLGLGPETPVALYTGTFEHYQGLDLLYGAMRVVKAARPDARLVLVGGTPAQVEAARREIQAAGIADVVIMTGQRPSEEIPSFLDAATILVSPRSTGTNTPLKIYQYLRSGRPTVATDLRTHTQVLSHDTAFLAEPTADGFAAAMLEAFNDPARATAIGARARQLAETRYSDEAYMAKTRHAVSLLFADRSSAVEQGVA